MHSVMHLINCFSFFFFFCFSSVRLGMEMLHMWIGVIVIARRIYVDEDNI